MSHSVTYSISQDERALERAFSALYREVGPKPSRAKRVDCILGVCNAATWVYTLASLMHNL